MPFFADSERLYAAIQALLARVEEDDRGAANAIQASHMVIRLACANPSAEVLINGRKRPLEVSYGASHLRPTLDIELEADTLYRIMLGEVSMKRALAKGKLKVKGQVWKSYALGDLFYRGQALYPEVLAELGLALAP